MPSVRCSRSVLCGAKRQADNFGLGELLLQSSCSEIKVRRTCPCGYRLWRFACEAPVATISSLQYLVRNYPDREISHNRKTECQRRLYRRCDAPINPPRFRLISHRFYLCCYRLWRFAREEPVATAADTGRLNGENQGRVVGAVEERHQALLACDREAGRSLTEPTPRLMRRYFSVPALSVALGITQASLVLLSLAR